jgi:DNA-binding transcriptional ArsR family regulator
MAGVSEEALDRLFHALADPTRRRLLAQLALGPAQVTDLARPFRMSLPAVSKHLRILEEAGLAARVIDGRVHRLSLTGGPLEAVENWLDPFRSFWDPSVRDLRHDLALPPPQQPVRDRRNASHATRDGVRDERAGGPEAARASDDSTP